MNQYKPYKQIKCTEKELAEKWDNKIEDSHLNIAELVEIMPKIGFQAKITLNFYWGVGLILCKNGAM